MDPGRGRGRGQRLLSALKEKAKISDRESEKESQASASPPVDPSKFEDVPETSEASASMPSAAELRARLGAIRGRGALLARFGKPRLAVQDSGPTAVSKATHEAAPEPIDAPQAPISVPKRTQRYFKGTAGNSINITSNFFELKTKLNYGIFFYDVTFSPLIDSQRERFRLIDSLVPKIGPTKNFDGARKLFLPKMLGSESVTEMVKDAFGKTVHVTLTFKKEITDDEYELISFYNILLARAKNKMDMVRMKKNYYLPSKAVTVPEYKLEVWPGYVTSIERQEGGLMLQLDVSHRILRQETAYDTMNEIRKRTDSATFLNAVQKALIGTSIITRYNNRVYSIDDVDFTKSPQSTFTDNKGCEISLKEYYRRHHQLEIKDVKQPLLINRPKKSETDIKEIWLIPELCNLTGLTDAMRENFHVMKEVGKVTRVAPNNRQVTLEQFVAKLKSTPAALEEINRWGIELVNDKPLTLEGRNLNRRTLTFGKGFRHQVSDNVDWTREATKKECLEPKSLENWAIFFTRNAKSNATRFAETIAKVGGMIGMKFKRPQMIELPNDRTDTYLNAINKITTNTMDLVVTICPQQRADRYGSIKKCCYLEKSLASQVILEKTIRDERKLNSVCSKIALQINCKMGGSLWGAVTPFRGLMVVGIDVFHDPSRKGLSYFGLVASLNDTSSHWISVAGKQGTGQELSEKLAVPFMESLATYYKKNGTYPVTIVVYRDGVGEGQLRSLVSEINQLRGCFEKLKNNDGSPYKPGFDFVVVQKRISYRLLLQAQDPRNIGNPPPGTIVDHKIVKRDCYDFLLVSQKVNQGTVSPTHYIVVNDDANLDPNKLQQLTYTLTHMYYNWPGTIRVPACTQYAHKLAAMVGEHLHQVPGSGLQEKLFYL